MLRRAAAAGQAAARPDSPRSALAWVLAQALATRLAALAQAVRESSRIAELRGQPPWPQLEPFRNARPMRHRPRVLL
jgi:hypothetical protein